MFIIRFAITGLKMKPPKPIPESTILSANPLLFLNQLTIIICVVKFPQNEKAIPSKAADIYK